MTFLLDAFQQAAAAGALDTTAFDAQDLRTGPADSEAYVELNTDGSAVLYGNVSTSPVSPRWWTDGSPPATWVLYTSTGNGTIMGGLSASTRYQLNTLRTIGNSRLSLGVASRTFTLSFYDAASGGNLLGTKTFTTACEKA